MSKIKSCPFCDSTASVRINYELQDTDLPNLVVACDNPECQVYQAKLHETYDEAITAWNIRASDWISVDNRLPDIGVVVKFKGKYFERIGFRYYDSWYVINPDFNDKPDYPRITHWMLVSLPENYEIFDKKCWNQKNSY